MRRKEAKLAGLTHYTTGKPCIRGHIAARRVSDRVCMECDRKNKKANPPSAEYKRQQYIKHREQWLVAKQKYRQTARTKLVAAATARKKYVKRRTPKWVTDEELWLIAEVYALAALRTKIFGFSWHVDHIIPLQGKIVSGLHVPNNMQVIPALENMRKKNKYEVADVL